MLNYLNFRKIVSCKVVLESVEEFETTLIRNNYKCIRIGRHELIEERLNNFW